MFKLLSIFLVNILCALATTFTGALPSPVAAGTATGTLVLSLTQSVNLTAACGGGGLNPTAITIALTSGAPSGTVNITGNDCMIPGNLSWQVQYTDTGTGQIFTAQWKITGTTFNLSNQVVQQSGTVQLNPSSNQYVNQPVGTSLFVNNLSGIAVNAPYITISGVRYVAATMFPFTPFFSGSFLDAQTATLTSGNQFGVGIGSELISYTGGTNTQAWYYVAATGSVEAEWQGTTSLNNSVSEGIIGIWLCDATNGKVYSLDLLNNTGANGGILWEFLSWTLAGCAPGTPSTAVSLGSFPIVNAGIAHAKLVKTGGNVQALVSYDAGQTTTQLGANQAVGTLSKGGVVLRISGASNVIVNATFLSVAVN